uniref:ribonuclease P/MRP protein subunit POP5 isoform X3 n=1 Tax=Myxine glutinosa TaxID=7769 RepID=UPI00358E8206
MVRLKNRYVLCAVRGGDSALRALSPTAVYNTVSHALLVQHGMYGQARCLIGMTVSYVNMKTGVVIVRVRKDSLPLLSSALPFVSDVGFPPNRVQCNLHTLHVGEERQRVREAITSTCFPVDLDKDVDADLDMDAD